MKLNLRALDRRVIYLVVILSVALPIGFDWSIPPARMVSAEKFFALVQTLETDANDVALVAFDFGPNTKAENEPQAEVILEHLFRRRIPVVLVTQYAQAEGFLLSIPNHVADRLMRENPGERWEYGKDWVNIGYRPGGILFVQAVAKSQNLANDLDRDVFGTPLIDLTVTRNLKNLRDVRLLAEFTGLVGVFDTYVQFFQSDGYTPAFGHGCTSITIPEAYIYLDSGQLSGLLEGIAGAAWYSQLLTKSFPNRGEDSSLVINTALGVAHLVMIFFIVLGNISLFTFFRRKRREG